MAIPSDAFARQAATEHHLPLIRYLAGRLRRGEDAKDLAQEVYLHLLKVDVRAVKHPLDYVLRCASRALADFYEKKSLEPLHVDERFLNHSPDHLGGNGDPAAQIDLEHDLLRAIRRLDRTRRHVFVMRAVHRRGYSDIASELGLAEETVRIYYYQAAARVRAAITGSQGVHSHDE
jgi:RNA polymerase sigma-70 factor (ECF subfamily)